MSYQAAEGQAGRLFNQRISALKFGIILEFLQLGWNVFLADVDIIMVQVRADAGLTAVAD